MYDLLASSTGFALAYTRILWDTDLDKTYFSLQKKQLCIDVKRTDVSVINVYTAVFG